MPKYVCIKSSTKSVPVGTEIIATPLVGSLIMVTRDSDLTIPEAPEEPFFQRGVRLLLNGELWHWEEVKTA